MTNHVHLIVVPSDNVALAKAVGRTHWIYMQTINGLHGRSGHFWQNRFYSCALGEQHLWAALLRYVENNPVRARLARQAWNYPWSSAKLHVSIPRDDNGLLDFTEWSRIFTAGEWQAHLRAALTDQDREQIKNLRHPTSRGRPLGSDHFVAKLEVALNTRLRAAPWGRPRKPPKT